MAGINWGRVVRGGLLAGLVMNISEAGLHGAVLGGDGQELYKSLGIAFTPQPVHLISVIAMTFVLGIATVWLYAAIRPRYGAGPKTAICAGLAVWLLVHFWSGVYLAAGFPGLVTPKLAWLPVVWGLFEAPIAALIGGWIYKEA